MAPILNYPLMPVIGVYFNSPQFRYLGSVRETGPGRALVNTTTADERALTHPSVAAAVKYLRNVSISRPEFVIVGQVYAESPGVGYVRVVETSYGKIERAQRMHAVPPAEMLPGV